MQRSGRTRSRSRYRTIAVLAVVALLAAGAAGCKVVLAPSAAAPIRAAFYYPWFGEAWVQQGQNPFTNYTPTRGYYSLDEATVRGQIADMQYAGISLGIASWFGQGKMTDRHWPTLIAAAEGTGFGWAPYYEPEGVSDPTPAQITDDLHYLYGQYTGSSVGSGLEVVTGKGMVVFVYNADDATQAKGCDTVDRWTQARRMLQDQYHQTIYLDLKVFPAYASCAGASGIDGWHQYAPRSGDHNFASAPGDGAYSISPGYWKAGAAYGTAPFLARDRTRWQASIASMNASGAEWQLITTYNEWGEGTAVESSSGCRSPAPDGTYCDWSAAAPSDFLTDLHDHPPN